MATVAALKSSSDSHVVDLCCGKWGYRRLRVDELRSLTTAILALETGFQAITAVDWREDCE